MTLSLDLSKKLHELGVVVESEHVWMIPNLDMKSLTYRLGLADDFVDSKLFSVIPAPTFEELWAVMPASIKHHEKQLGQGYASYSNLQNSNDNLHYELNESPTEALGQLALWLKDNGHMEDN